jgi:DNA-binding NtrC family response regulator
VTRPADSRPPPAGKAPPAGDLSLDEVEKNYLREALDSQGWNRSRAARRLGISRHRLSRLLSKHGLQADRPPRVGSPKP